MQDLVMEPMALDLSHVTTQTAVVHALPHVGPHCLAIPSFRMAATSSLSMRDVEPGMRTVITGTSPISGQELAASRQELAEAVARLRTAADDEGGDGFLLGYDPLNPDRRIPSSELALGDACLFVWDRAPGEGPVFEWDEVAYLLTTETSIEVYLVDGRTAFIHAAIDWWNLLS
jgi:hypothetical protein